MKISHARKIKEGRGLGEGSDYLPYIKTRELSSLGTCSNFVDWKTGRQLELLSQTELGIYMQLRWQDDIVDIKEQYPLDMGYVKEILSLTNEQLDMNNMPILSLTIQQDESITTDFLVTLKNGLQEAYSVKYDVDLLNNRDIERLWIEKLYWNSKGIDFFVKQHSDINPILVSNLRLIAEYYDASRIHDVTSYIKHLIVTKQFQIDLENELLDFDLILK